MPTHLVYFNLKTKLLICLLIATTFLALVGVLSLIDQLVGFNLSHNGQRSSVVTYSNHLCRFKLQFSDKNYQLIDDAENNSARIELIDFPHKGSVFTPRITIDCIDEPQVSVADYVDSQMAECEPGMGCQKEAETVQTNFGRFESYHGPSYVVPSLCFVQQLTNKKLVRVCDQALGNETLRSRILESVREF